MEISEFRKLLIWLYDYYNRDPKSVSSRKVETWFEDIARIPDEATDRVKAFIKDEYDDVPKNLPKAIKRGFGLWLQENPERRAFRRDEKDGAACFARGCDAGLIHARRFDDQSGAWVVYAFRCAACNPGGNGYSIPSTSAMDLEAKGYRIDRLEDVPRYFALTGSARGGSNSPEDETTFRRLRDEIETRSEEGV
jgi:hypothetical protein